MSLRSYVAAIRAFPANASVGYGRRWRAGYDTCVGVIPIGYADGIRRGLSNIAEVLVGGQSYPTIGTISMDNLAVDLGPSAGVKVGDEVVLIGNQDGGRIRAEDLAKKLGTINYEITCGISRRVPPSFLEMR
jgi:alanine racemase